MKKKQNQPDNGVILHGECMIFKSALPKDAKKIDLKGNSYLIVADSETTGNHHVVDAAPSVTFYESEGKRYMNSTGPTQVRCLHADRHDTIQIPAGTYEFGSQQEYDPFTARMQAVRD